MRSWVNIATFFGWGGIIFGYTYKITQALNLGSDYLNLAEFPGKSFASFNTTICLLNQPEICGRIAFWGSLLSSSNKKLWVLEFILGIGGFGR